MPPFGTTPALADARFRCWTIFAIFLRYAHPGVPISHSRRGPQVPFPDNTALTPDVLPSQLSDGTYISLSHLMMLSCTPAPTAHPDRLQRGTTTGSCTSLLRTYFSLPDNATYNSIRKQPSQQPVARPERLWKLARPVDQTFSNLDRAQHRAAEHENARNLPLQTTENRVALPVVPPVRLTRINEYSDLSVAQSTPP